MKKFTLFTLLISSFAFAQSYTVTSSGLKPTDAPEKDYVVLEVPGKTAKELYTNALKYVQKTYKNPDEVLKGQVEGEYLRFETHADKVFFLAAGLGTKNWSDINYTTQLDFKDGKVKYTIYNVVLKPDNIQAKYTIEWVQNGMMAPGLYDKKGVLKQPDAKLTIESYFNDNLALIKKAFIDDKSDDKW